MSSSEHRARDEQLLSVGKQCHHETCHLVDFLPFKCQHCTEAFCQEHFLPNAHACPKYDETKHNRVAPSCPMCNVPVAIRPGQDPNVRMEQHLERECSAMTGVAPKKSGPVCEKVRCGKVLVSPIRCDRCRKQFCPSHRFPSDHTCTPQAPTTTARLGSETKQLAGAARGAMKNAMHSANRPSPRTEPASSKAPDLSKLKLQNPVKAVKVDRSSPTLTSPNLVTTTSVTSTPSPTTSATSCAIQSAAADARKRNPYVPPPLFAF
ncbi:hypothetical protein BD626DRAFT_557352 [Schizophyllum amplum]|uniref:AN1-type domain-containing protein n=1 Tax=Schizophyllum amplum TaxID=97359 RepID=A0A550CH27_9AGAR|nr:hypothetical protein BD626DRAFT_557352 [Auriculariopsis ampla]